MELKQFSKFSVSKKNRYEKLPLDNGEYLVLGVGNYHGMSISDKDYFNISTKEEARSVLIVKCQGDLISTKPFSVSFSDLSSLMEEDYIETVN